jgi:hypothetical protein
MVSQLKDASSTFSGAISCTLAVVIDLGMAHMPCCKAHLRSNTEAGTPSEVLAAATAGFDKRSPPPKLEYALTTMIPAELAKLDLHARRSTRIQGCDSGSSDHQALGNHGIPCPRVILGVVLMRE